MTDRIGPKHHINESDFSIQQMYRKGTSSMPRPHTHPFYEIYYLVQGERVYFMNSTVYTVSKGELMFINPDTLHSTASSDVDEFERILVHFSHDFVAQGDARIAELLPFAQSRLVRLPVTEQPTIERLLERMLLECEAQSPHYVSYVRSLLIELIILVYRIDEINKVLPTYAHPMHHKVSEIALYINRHFDQQITLEQTAKDFYISPSYLSRVFKKLTGFHFREYLQVVRIREAQKLLVQTKDSVQLISEQVGFEHIAHFNKTFKKLTATTPLRYRNENKEVPPNK
jgi:AraC family transcriptional regulator, arabinose operon regulatory protein